MNTTPRPTSQIRMKSTLLLEEVVVAKSTCRLILFSIRLSYTGPSLPMAPKTFHAYCGKRQTTAFYSAVIYPTHSHPRKLLQPELVSQAKRFGWERK